LAGSWVKIQQRHELFSSICWCFFYWKRSLGRCTQSISTQIRWKHIRSMNWTITSITSILVQWH
jgi:hypothetical protein